MKSIICSIISYNGIIYINVILAHISSVHSSASCGLYGDRPCQFVPAPPGHTPACARPGQTYCEHVDNYPTYLIKHLVHKWGYEGKSLLVDETWDDFSAVSWHEPPSTFYDPAYIFPHQNFGNDFSGYKYDTPATNGGNLETSGGAGNNYIESTYIVTKQHQPTEPPTYLLYSSAGQRLSVHKNHLNGNGISTRVTPNSQTLWLKRIVRDLSQKQNQKQKREANLNISAAKAEAMTNDANVARSTRDVSINMDLLDIVGVDRSKLHKNRTKRQSPGRNSLCQTTSQFVTPQAALNSQGNWMFVVNAANTARQLVRAELCASNTCSNLCQLPNGYNSRCEQKYAQKRLIALQGDGQKLYTDTFWFPSCCVCTISAN